MVMATKFYLCTICGNVIFKCIDSGVDVNCCGKQMQELIPSTTESGKEKHLPVVERRLDGSIKVKVGSQAHPMLPEHHISFIYLETEHGGQVKYLKPGEAPEAVFKVCKDKAIAVYAYCNVHGLWKTDISQACNRKSCCGFLGLVMAFLFCLLPCSSCGKKVDNSTVKTLDIKRYLGSWYEIARYDHSFERGLSYAHAQYALNDDGTVSVTNSGLKDGKHKISKGKAKLTDTAGLLRVSFFGPFYSDYRVMMLSEDYNYALVGSGSDKYLWILSRTPQVPSDILESILKVATERGFNTDKLIWVEQSGYSIQ